MERIIEDLYLNKKKPSNYIEIEGQGLFRIGDANPLGWDVPKLEGEVIGKWRWVRGSKTAKGEVGGTYRFIPTKLKLKNGETFKASTRDAGRGFDPMFGDYVGAISNNAIGFGHKLSYYDGFISTETIKRGYGKITYGHTTEAFANFTALSNTVNKEIYIKLMNYYAPQTTKVFTELYERSNLL